MDKRQERWEAARGIIEHEDNLVNHRFTWFFTLQGFLFTGLTLGANSLASGANKEYHGLIHVLLFLVAAAGLITPFLVVPAIRAANRQALAASYWWREHGSKPDTEWETRSKEEKFPPVKGPAPNEFDYLTDCKIPADKLKVSSKLGTYWLPHFMAVVWLLALGMILYSWASFARTPQPSGTKVSITQDRQIDNLKVDFAKPTP